MKFRTLLIVFFTVLIVEIAANLFDLRSVQYSSKPSLMLLLIYYFVSNAKSLAIQKNLIIAALSFSLLGDVVLLLEKQYTWVFAVGLASFLIAHVFYVVYFWEMRKFNLKSAAPNFLSIFAVAAYSITFYFFLFSNVGNLKIPILIYTIVISLMLMISLSAFELKSQTFGKICVAGTILFTFSDSILAINRFVFSIYFGSALVMLVYATGQLLITEGALRNLKQINMGSRISK
jgi:uncharacterized membrane protein YhhN